MPCLVAVEWGEVSCSPSRHRNFGNSRILFQQLELAATPRGSKPKPLARLLERSNNGGSLCRGGGRTERDVRWCHRGWHMYILEQGNPNKVLAEATVEAFKTLL